LALFDAYYYSGFLALAPDPGRHPVPALWPDDFSLDPSCSDFAAVPPPLAPALLYWDAMAASFGCALQPCPALFFFISRFYSGSYCCFLPVGLVFGLDLSFGVESIAPKFYKFLS